MSGVLPPIAHRRSTERAPGHPLLWIAREGLSVDALSGQAGTLTQAGAVTVTDSAGGTVGVNNASPPWSSNVGQAVIGLLLGTATKVLAWPLNIVPQACCGMIDFVENGGLAIASAGVWYLGNDAATGARLWLDSSSTQYRMNYTDGATTRTCTMTGTAPTSGQRVRLRWVLSATGTIQLNQSINGAAETSPAASAATALPASWAGTTCRINSVGTANYGNNLYLGVVVMMGNQSLTDTQAQLTP